MRKITTFVALAFISFTSIGCDRFLDIQPEGKVIPTSVEDYRKILTSAYAKYPIHKSLSALRTDEMVIDEDTSDFPYYRELAMWKDSNYDAETKEFHWADFYTVIFYLNQAINEGSKTMKDSPEKNQILAEAYALRAYSYFDLINLYAKPYNNATASSDRGVPITLETDMEAVLKPSTVQQVYNQIHADMEKAQGLMVEQQQTAGNNYKFSKNALMALNARMALYQGDWNKALNDSQELLAVKGELSNLNTTNTAPNHYASAESILALDNPLNNSVQNVIFASPELISKYNTTTDKRFGIYFEKSKNRYKAIKGGSNDFRVSFRTAELYFIKSEALLKLNRLDEAKEAILPVLKNRYTAEGYTSVQSQINGMNTTDFMNFILDERFREFAMEGHRWFDLRRADQKKIVHTVLGKEYILQQNDPRYTIEYPMSAKKNNPNL
ncbi:RagB/SusD family nutrient uptake outer membrane protein [Chryseobacterium indologenes]|uniref:RagB/SusD family nutrient uptake outer membrane protein n=1 Tax=Chryseobacterium TaxID=59732 RepID=UPI0003E06A9D|nr:MULTISPECIES: RagB/SusD family nutrient uptake outer membrane protein [Chryseobacterium]ASE62263.1 RagB/SusD family nutrient uptake outer membrane protein [Chryseobacterium indologenes]ATN06099.1 RagB/SusD family nutrient uptake outer membrane protein [Chryseobacterium indologenes]AYY85141.1 RagB/SusD family nutrient uptake outer membrane protein [Chryseobacterium indologenes]AYZ34814.1 RagB/SusD family nutrient uptake outer membrane protein [Chryseobacterium indologenes]MBF6643405.1 RagB/S